MNRTDRASLLIHADRAVVFDALTSRDAMLEWLPPSGMRGFFQTFDMREGGSFRMVLTHAGENHIPGKTSADSDVSEVTISRIVAGAQIVMEVTFDSTDEEFGGTMQMEWNLTSSAAGTDVQVVARNVPPGIRPSEHAEGITSSLVNLSRYLETSRATEPEETGSAAPTGG